MLNITQKPSPNFSDRVGLKPEVIVLHIMAGSLSGTDDWFSKPVSQVSAHYGIGLNGAVHQYVKDYNAAWANGRVLNPTAKLVKAKEGINPNRYTLSIEHENQDLSKGTAAQLNASAELIRSLAAKYNIPIDRDHIIGHYEIFSAKPNCPATDKTIIDKLIKMALDDGYINLKVRKEQADDVLRFISNLNK